MARVIARVLLVPMMAGPAIIGWWAWDANLATALYVAVLVLLLGPTLLVAFGSAEAAPSTSRPYRSWSDLPGHNFDDGGL